MARISRGIRAEIKTKTKFEIVEVTGDSGLPDVDINQIKQHKLEFLHNIMRGNIEKNYPDWKQRSDFADTNFYGTKLLLMNDTYTPKTIYDTAYNKAYNILENGSTLETELSDLPETEQSLWEQLIKAAVRIGWLQKCKEIYKEVEANIQAATTEEDLDAIKLGEIQTPDFPF